ncbi:DegV family protein [Vallitalea okinawensis]|uniref:DegV family protein n=1 Tax=Vallitalea okinawensis TaxID=2078660 RepID=UPI000CFBA7A6|nr:DegV family protein [Vallitalea okinawensis]
MSIKIITDSTCYIPEHLVEKYNIDIISLNLFWDDKTIKETEMDNNAFYNLLATKDVFPKSSQPAIQDVIDTFEKNIIEGDEIIGIFLSSKMSGTYQSTHMVKEQLLVKYPEAKIHLIDSLSNSMELGYVALKAAELASLGQSANDIINASKDIIMKSKFIFMPGTLEYLRRGGRIGRANALVGSLLRITPLLTVEDGVTSVLSKVRTKKKAIDTMTTYVEEQINTFGLGDIIVHHIQNECEAKTLAKRLEKIVGQPVDICSIGPVIGAHVGPGAIGIVYYTKELPATQRN